jgi:hypothetical protein
MEFLTALNNNLSEILKLLIFILLIVFFGYLIYAAMVNVITTCKYKRQWFEHNKRYSVKRCRDEGERNQGRDNFYLLDEEKKKYHRISPYALERLGYPRPPRLDDDRFTFKESDYTIGKEIKIRNIISLINTIKGQKN